jgi:peptidyl-prolyl cis-trans isomerase SurA
MEMMLRKKTGLLTLIFLIGLTAQSQKTLDGIAAVVGEEVVLISDIEAQYHQLRMQGQISGSEKAKCDLLKSMIVQKMLLYRAIEVDSVEISDAQVEANMSQRMRYFVNQMGSEEKLAAYYNKSIEDIKDEFRKAIREQMLVQRERQELTKNVTITPSEVNHFYKNLPTDSIPMIQTEYVIGQIMKKPPINPAELNETRAKLKKLRQRIVNGEKFSTLAILYSEDQASAKNGGELGFYGRGELYPEFEAVAFNLDKGEVSEIVKTKAGFHIIQLIDRRGDLVNVRHILMSPKPSASDLMIAKNELDSIARLIRNGDYSFEEAAKKFSDAPDAINGGMMVNPITNNNKFKADELSPDVSYAVRGLEEGEISAAMPMVTDENRKAYRILFLKEKSEPHQASLKKDYNTIQDWALEEKKSKKINSWIQEAVKNTYIRINDPFKDCDFEENWQLF